MNSYFRLINSLSSTFGATARAVIRPFLIYVACCAVLRGVLVYAFHQDFVGSSFSLLLQAFWIGLRMDLTITCLVLSPFVLYVTFFQRLIRRRLHAPFFFF